MTTLDSPTTGNTARSPQTSRTPEAPEVLVPRLRAAYASGRTRSLAWRHEQLAALERMLVEREADFTAALVEDLGRPPFEAWAADLRVSVREVQELRRHLEAWTAPRRQRVPALFRPATASVVVEPLGVALVIGPWNYPVQLLACPMAAALAAGNAVVLKPSEVAAATSRAFARFVPEYLDPAAVAVVEGGVAETTALLEQRFDHVFYTGNGTVGRIVAQAAARHLTPVTLELGGKSPVIVAADANLGLAASRVAFSRFLNAGQTCVASDHVYVHRDVEQEFLEALATEIRKRYGADPRTSRDFGRMVSRRHTERVKTLLDGGGYDVVVGGEVDLDEQYVAPTVVRATSPDAPLMQEEIFGPVLPVLSFTDVAEVCATIAAGDKPLALYLFTGSEEVVEQVIGTTSSGGVCVNDALTHLLVSALPFGGVGESGHGSYHGRWGIDTFSHHKAVYRRPTWYRDLPLLNPPYGWFKQKAARRFF